MNDRGRRRRGWSAEAPPSDFPVQWHLPDNRTTRIDPRQCRDQRCRRRALRPVERPASHGAPAAADGHHREPQKRPSPPRARPEQSPLASGIPPALRAPRSRHTVHRIPAPRAAPPPMPAPRPVQQQGPQKDQRTDSGDPQTCRARRPVLPHLHQRQCTGQRPRPGRAPQNCPARQPPATTPRSSVAALPLYFSCARPQAQAQPRPVHPDAPPHDPRAAPAQSLRTLRVLKAALHHRPPPAIPPPPRGRVPPPPSGPPQTMSQPELLARVVE
jgi:neural Wiskott-Aldrich syndrome protein